MAQENKPINLTASKQILSAEGWLAGYLVNTNSTFIIYHGTAAANTGSPFGGIITPASTGYHSLGNMHSTAGAYCYVPAGETIDLTFLVKETN